MAGAEAVLDAIATHRIASLGGVAPQLALLLRSEAFDALRHLQRVRPSSWAAPPRHRPWSTRPAGASGPTYSIRYSSTESGGVGTGTAFDADDAEALHTVGRPRAGVELVVGELDDAGAPVPAPDRRGRRGLAVVPDGHGRLPRATPRPPPTPWSGRWLRTGDLGRLGRPAACLRLAGRRSEMYIRGGYNVHPQEVEAVLAQHPDVVEVAVVAPAPTR